MPVTLEEIRNDLPVTAHVAYLNSGSAGPLPVRTTNAIIAEAERQLHAGRSNFNIFMNEYFPLLDDLRARFARLLKARSDEIALTHHTTEGMNIVVWGLPWQAGDEIVTTNQEHEGVLLPVYAAARRFGLIVKVVDVADEEQAVVEKVRFALSPRTRLVALSHVSYLTGAILPVAPITEAVHQVGALVAVDGAQSAGAIPVDVPELGVDFYAIPGQKWLCGPEGVGALYVRYERVGELFPTFVGFFSMRDYEARDYSGYYIPARGAQRYESGTLYWPALFGMRESLRWLEEEVGYDYVLEQGAAITHLCRQMLSEVAGVTVHSPSTHAGLTTFSIRGHDAMPVVEELGEQGVVIRPLHEPGHMRASTGFFNSEADLARLVEGVKEIVARSR